MSGSMIFIAGSECLSGPEWKEYCCKTVPAPAAKIKAYRGQESSSTTITTAVKVSTTELDKMYTNPYKTPHTTPSNSARWERMRCAATPKASITAPPMAKAGSQRSSGGDVIPPVGRPKTKIMPTDKVKRLHQKSSSEDMRRF